MTSKQFTILGAVGGGVAALLVLAALVGSRVKVDMKDIFGGHLKPSESGAATSDGALPILSDTMPEFTGITAWINSPPLTQAQLRGKVVLIDFWTYSCINCLRTLPYVTAWHDAYKDDGLVIIGVHTPEFAFEKEEKNVRDAVSRQHITYPVAMDNAYGTWNAYSNQYWPAKYLFDGNGKLRYVHFGEGDYDVTERNIRSLIAELGQPLADAETTVPAGDTDFERIGTPEIYIGYRRAEYFGGEGELAHDVAQTYTLPKTLRKNSFALGGTWTVDTESAEASAGATFSMRYSASNANVVMGAAVSVKAEVTLDGKPVPEAMRGGDVIEENGKTYVTVQDERLYDVIDARGQYGEHVLQLRFPTGGARLYALTFG